MAPQDLEEHDVSGFEPMDDVESIRGAARVFAVGGGRGGVGKSLVSQNLAVYLAQLGKRVVLVDADPTGGNMHAQFGLTAGKIEPFFEHDPSELQAFLVPTEVQGLQLLPAAHDALDAVKSSSGNPSSTAKSAPQKGRWISKIRSIPADFIVIDAGPGHGPRALDILLSADLPILVTTPEPPAIETLYRFLRAAFRRRLRRTVGSDRYRLSLLDRAGADVGLLPSPVELIRAFAKMDPQLAELAWAEACRLRFYSVVNQTRLRNDPELGLWIGELSSRFLGISIEELGHIEHDDGVWVAVRRNKPLLLDSPTSKAARNLERIARRVLALTASPPPGLPPRPVPPEPPTLYAILAINRSANDEEIRRAFRRQQDVYAKGGLATSSLLSPARLTVEQGRLSEAYDTLLDPVRRRAYDLSTFGASADSNSKAPESRERPALVAEQLMLQSQLLREIGPDTEFTGELLRKVRESQGIEIEEICARTKITHTHIRAIEDEKFYELPPAVYIRGFVNELAKFLKLDAAQVTRTYLRRVRTTDHG